MWTTCTRSSQCCGQAQCLEKDGWKHCNLPTNLQAPSNPTKKPTLPRPTRTPKPKTPLQMTRSPTKLPSPLPPSQGVPLNPSLTPSPISKPTSTEDIIGPDNNSERVKLPRPPRASVVSSQDDCPHNEAGLVNWSTLFSAGVGQPVNIPANTRVIIRQSIPTRLGLIDIPPTSELIIGENAKGVSLNVTGISVRGKFTIGSETCRILTKVTITLHGSRPANAVTSVPDATKKGISVSGGILSFHGKRYSHSWTRLAATAYPGDTSLRLQEDVNWESGQEIVLVSTAMKDSKDWHQNEVLRVKSVDNSPDIGSVVYLQSGIRHKHVGIKAYQAEVGLLSRNIVVQGSDSDSDPFDSEPRKCTGPWTYGTTDEPCTNTGLTGYGGHIIVHNGGQGYVEGVELFRMGQTNVLGRYPIHFHLLNNCPTCYFKDSSVHKSYYRCVSIHGTNYVTVSENVAYDVSGFCYYLEDGVEQFNKIHFNLAAHIHMIGPSIPRGDAQQTEVYQQSESLTLPADVTAAGFYITNIRNEIIGNAASGGWAGFAFPNLRKPIGLNRNVNMRPSAVVPLPGDKLDGNTAHSSGWFWYHAGAFYFGGALYYNDKNVLEYNPGRSFNVDDDNRRTCAIDLCAAGNCYGWCPPDKQAFVRLTNTKAFLAPSVGLNAWSGHMEIVGFECNDCGLSIEALESGFWIDNMLVSCRTGEPLSLPDGSAANYIRANGFGWYDTDQEHIITRSTFRNCGIKLNGRGCDSNAASGCDISSSVFTFLTHSSQFNPEIMQVSEQYPSKTSAVLYTRKCY
jgi:G8 domain